MSIKFETASDDTNIYSFEDFCKLFDDVESNPNKMMLISDIILVLLYSQNNKPIYGRTMLIKQLFLLYNEVFIKFKNINCQKPNFVPYDFGPYSFKSMQILDDLRFSKVILVDGRKNSKKESFRLSQAGIKRAKEKFDYLPDSLQQEIVDKRIGWDQWGTRGILKYVYERYPEMKVNSKIKGRYKDITWGKGRA